MQESNNSKLKSYLTTFLKFLLFLGVGLTILFLVYRNQSEKYINKCVADGNLPEDCSLFEKVLNDFASANYFWLFIMVFIYMISNVSRTIRWVMLIKPMGYQPKFLNAFCAVMLNYFANLGLPRVGEFVRAGTLAKYENIPMEKLMGTVVTDRIIDVMCFAVVMAIAFFIEFDTLWQFTIDNMGNPDELIFKLVILGIIGLGLLTLLYLFRKKIQGLKSYQKILNILQGFWEGIQTVKKLDRPGLFIFHSINIWIMYFLMVYVGTFSFEPVHELGVQGSTVIFAGGSLGIVIPAPGGMGSYQFIVTEILDKIYGIPSDEGFSFSNILFFTIQFGGNIVFGLLALLALPIINRKK